MQMEQSRDGAVEGDVLGDADEAVEGETLGDADGAAEGDALGVKMDQTMARY
jgi:hypothetical protein